METGDGTWRCIWESGGFGIQLKELRQAAGGMDYMGVSVAVKRLERRIAKDAALSAALQCCRKQLQMSNVDSAENPPSFERTNKNTQNESSRETSRID
jgi:hypothetical protein